MKNKMKFKSHEFKQTIDCLDESQCVYIDESGIKSNLIRDYG